MYGIIFCAANRAILSRGRETREKETSESTACLETLWYIYRNIRLVNKAKPTDRRIYSLRSFDLFVVDTLSKTLGEGINLFWSQRSE